MSSWGSVSLKSKLKYTDLYCRLSKSGYGTNFQNFLMCYLFTKYKKQKLYLCDTTNNISNSFHLILDTFQTPSNIIYTNKSGISIFQNSITELNIFLMNLTDEIICSEARSIFRWNLLTQKKIDNLLLDAAFPDFDIGIHIRTGDKITTGEMNKIRLDTYVSAIKELQAKPNINIYIMTDNTSIISKLKEIVDPKCSLYSLTPPISFSTGHVQSEFNNKPTADKMAAYYHFLTELHILQRCPQIICTYSSNIGRFLYMTREPNTNIKSLDIQEFTILHDMTAIKKSQTTGYEGSI